nr:iron-siderophore ABC transporter substrate-binding protein [Pseudonocardia sp. C8]
MGLVLAGCGGAGGGAEGPKHSVQHAMGASDVPVNPQRVVVLDTGELDSVLALGVKPVGAVRADEVTGPQSYLGQKAQGIQEVGTIEAPNLEAIAALKPDLILSNSVRHKDIYPQLSEIAPTVFAASVGKSWKENFRLAGTALGKSDQAEKILADYQNKAKQVGTAFGNPAQVEVSMVRFMANGVRVYGQGSFIGTILADAGFARPQIARTDKTFVQVGPEQITQADGDLLFYAGYGKDGMDQQAKLAAGPLWQRLGAVTRGAAHPVSDDLWYLGIGPLAANQVLDELPRYAPRA